MFERLPLPALWPVYVSQAEASAFARWRGRRLPTEAEYQRAAFDGGDGPRPYPWGDAAPTAQYGVFDFNSWEPQPVGTHPRGASAWGVEDLMGNGWEWTSTISGRFPASRPARAIRNTRRTSSTIALRDEGRVSGDGPRADAADVPQLVPPALSLCLRDVPLRAARVVMTRLVRTDLSGAAVRSLAARRSLLPRAVAAAAAVARAVRHARLRALRRDLPSAVVSGHSGGAPSDRCASRARSSMRPTGPIG